MVWLYLLAATAGIVVGVPALLQVIDGRPMRLSSAVIGCGLAAFGLTGAVLSGFPSGRLLDFVAAAAVGLAAALLQPEFVASLRRRSGHEPITSPITSDDHDEQH